MRRGIKKLHELKSICYTARLVYINDYLADFPGSKASEMIGET